MLQTYLAPLEDALSVYQQSTEPKGLYDPIGYILGLPGKRIRPVLALLSAELYGDFKVAIPAAMAVEVFHNFTLLHDDIMDEAPLRRGHATVHHKWDLNTGILSGDAMLIKAYEHLTAYEPGILAQLLPLFNTTALQVCEGQQWDVEFEHRNTVSQAEYLQMIQYKTAVLLGCALKMGALVQQASTEDANHLYDFGVKLGTAFQIQDDYLDCFGNPETFGKQVGGDIIENKKTILYLLAKAQLPAEDLATLLQHYNSQPENPADKIEAVKALFHQSGTVTQTLNLVREYTEAAFNDLAMVKVPEHKKQALVGLAQSLMQRIQ